MENLTTISTTTTTTTTIDIETKENKSLPSDYEIICPPLARSFTCYFCNTRFKASYKRYYKTQTGWGCGCPICKHACYTRS